jgi:dihydropteroate synthase
MGIVNVTPDSFSDGGKFLDPSHAVNHALQLVAEGADILDIGGESTRPGATPVLLEEELRRVVPVVEGIVRHSSCPISVDTMKAEVARQCLEAGASIINDVTALRGDEGMLDVVLKYKPGVVLMHMQGNPQTMQLDPHYDDVTREITDFFIGRMWDLSHAGVNADTLCVDPGIGFGKTFPHTMQQLRELDQLKILGLPVMLGVSRKGFLGQVTGRKRDERMVASVAVASFALAKGTANILRVHDVAATVDAVKMWTAISTG